MRETLCDGDAPNATRTRAGALAARWRAAPAAPHNVRVRRRDAWSLGVLLSCAACAAPTPRLPGRALPPGCAQALLVTSARWDATDATLQRWRLEDEGTWRAVGAAVPVTLGRAGLGWGLGLHDAGSAAGPDKREGDGRSPAGVFSIGTAFGYGAAAPQGMSWPYRRAGARDYFIDDAGSADYNRWRRIPEGEANQPGARWGSFERMRRDDHVYEVGAVIEHNERRVPGAGSAIFLHVWGGPGAPTSGCTAMSRDDVLTVLRWLEPAAAPVLVQAPVAALPSLRLR